MSVPHHLEKDRPEVGSSSSGAADNRNSGLYGCRDRRCSCSFAYYRVQNILAFKTPIVYFISLFPVKLFFLAHRHPNCVFAYVCDRLNENKCIISDDSLFDISLPELFIKNVYIYFNFSIFSMFLFIR